jgi:hypothetical protein
MKSETPTPASVHSATGYDTLCDKVLICEECCQPISENEIRIFIPDTFDKDVSCCGYFHRDCGIEHELGEDGLLFEENVDRLFAIFTHVLKQWCDPDMVIEDMLPYINSANTKLNAEIRGGQRSKTNP